jgi:uncharacterized protein (DUF1015 family)
MAEIAPLHALRFDDLEIPAVVAPPYDVLGPAERAAFAARSPHNVVHVDLPLGDGDVKYENAAQTLATWRKQGVLRRDGRGTFVRYQQTFSPPGGGAPITRRGFFALVRAEPYAARVVLPHERTLSGPKEDRYKLFCATATALSPVFLLYRDPSGAVAKALTDSGPTFRWTSDDGIENAMARISEESEVHAIGEALRDQPLLIADGHHRYETTLRYGAAIDAERAEKGLPPAPNGAHKFVLAFLADADDPGLVVYPTHRLVKAIPSFDKQALLDGVRSLFDVTATRAEDVAALVSELAAAGKVRPSVAAVFPDGDAAILTLRADADVDGHPVLGGRAAVLRRTDCVLLHAGILEPVLGLTAEAQAKQTNLAYFKVAQDAVSALRGEGGAQVLFLMNGTPVADVRRSCEAGEVMPQKSTFFYPKVPTGVVMHALDPNDEVTRA